jgi:hypothetical protein
MTAILNEDPPGILQIVQATPPGAAGRGASVSREESGAALPLCIGSGVRAEGLVGNNSYFLQIVDMRTGRTSVVPSRQGIVGGFWITQDTLVASNHEQTKFLTFNVKTETWADLVPKNLGDILTWMISPDGKYLYFTTGGVVPKAEHIRFSDQQVDTIVSLKDFQSCAELWN